MVGCALLWTLLGPAIVALLIAVLGALEAALTTTVTLRRANPWRNMPAPPGLASSALGTVPVSLPQEEEDDEAAWKDTRLRKLPVTFPNDRKHLWTVTRRARGRWHRRKRR